MNVWVVDPRNYTPYYDYSLCKALKEMGCRVRWITRPYPYDRIENRDDLTIEYAFDPSLPVLARLKGGRLERFFTLLAYPLCIFQLTRRGRREKPDVIHVQWAPVPLVDLLLFRFVQPLSTQLVYTAHNVLPHEKYPWHTWLYRQLYGRADRLIVHSQAAARRLRQTFDISRDRIVVIPQGNLSDFARPVPKQQARRMLEINGQVTILFFGIIRPYKGLQHLLQALPRIREAVSDVHLLIAGHVHQNDDWGQYSTLIEQLGLEDVVSIHTTFVPHGQLGVYFGAADVVALPYTETTDSAVLTTAYTFGRPVVTTMVGGLPEAVEEGQSGRLVPPGDPDALAEVLIELLSDPDRLEDMGRFAGELAGTRHAWPSIAQATLDVYHSRYGSRDIG